MMLRITSNLSCRVLSQTNKTAQHIVSNSRFFHASCGNTLLRNNSIRGRHKHPNILNALFVRHASTDDKVSEIVSPPTNNPAAESTADLLDRIPDPPAPQPVDEIVQTLAQVHPNGEATLQSLGLGGWTPPGIIQSSLEWLHIGLDLPWCAAIAIGVIVVRIAVFPVMIYNQKHSARMMKVMPEMQEIQLRLSEARRSGDQYEAAKYAHELGIFMKEKKVNPMKSLAGMFIQAPIFCSFFLALRGMAYAPVPSFQDGGLWWFLNLTVPDPYYILPIVTCATLALTIELGVDGVAAENLGVMRYLFRAFPIILFPFMFNWPGAVLWYWCLNNFVSLIQAAVLRYPRTRALLKIPPLIRPDPKKLPIQKKDFIASVRDSWDNIKISKQLSDRQGADELQFMNAGRGSLIKTYKHDPTKSRTPQMTHQATMLSKKK